MRKGVFTAFCGVALLALVATLAQEAHRLSRDPALIRPQQVPQAPTHQAPVQRVQVQQEQKLPPDAEREAQARIALLRERMAEMAQSATPWPGFQRCLVGSASCPDRDERPLAACKAGGAEACDRAGELVPLASK
jgi:hypothetical protein